jgi:predicted Abi (CAAX) family protease
MKNIIFNLMTVKITILLKILENEVVFRVIVFPDSNATRGPSYMHRRLCRVKNMLAVYLKYHFRYIASIFF